MEFNRLIPELDVRSLEKSWEFYCSIGFVKMYEREEDKFMFLELQGNQIMIQELDGSEKWSVGELEYPFGRGINFSMEVDNVEEIYEKLQKNGYPIFRSMMENTYSGYVNKEFLVQDPDGYLLRFNQDI